ncbi:sensor histidine kinase [Fodinibius saliphilus]|uniref:sensor histidine kinase n=1 Tax=Fodinibius saliphilus TaxID=1920650 RepID=UPI00110845ED|nr:ATP-binding protein [Fodinibius saliphilus]
MSGKKPRKDVENLVHGHNWEESPLGPMEEWPEAFSGLFKTILEIKIPILICWGESLISIYNDAYRPLLGKNPKVMGQSFKEISSEAREIVGRQINQVLTTGEPVLINNVKFPVYRNDKEETVWFDYSYSPIRDYKGDIKGIIKMAIDVTDRVRAESELTKLHKLINNDVSQQSLNLKDYKNQLQELIYRLNKAQTTESHKIGKLIHDHLGQLLALCIIKTDQLRGEVKEEGILAKIEDLKELLLKANDKTSEFINMLKPPPILEKDNLVELMQWLAEQMSNYNLEVTIEDDGNPKRVSEENHLVLYESVRELCFNVIKHAGIDELTVKLERTHNQIHIIVKDKGKGFDVEKEKNQFEIDGGYGLFNINERMKKLGGSMTIESQKEKGTKVHLIFPAID